MHASNAGDGLLQQRKCNEGLGVRNGVCAYQACADHAACIPMMLDRSPPMLALDDQNRCAEVLGQMGISCIR